MQMIHLEKFLRISSHRDQKDTFEIKVIFFNKQIFKLKRQVNCSEVLHFYCGSPLLAVVMKFLVFFF